MHGNLTVEQVSWGGPCDRCHKDGISTMGLVFENAPEWDLPDDMMDLCEWCLRALADAVARVEADAVARVEAPPVQKRHREGKRVR